MKDTAEYEAIASRLRLLAHPERLRILDAVRRDAECVCHLEALLGKPQPYVSQQLRLLREGGLVSAEQQGQNIYYRLCNDEVAGWLDALLGPIAEDWQGLERHMHLPACPCPKCGDDAARTVSPVALEA